MSQQQQQQQAPQPGYINEPPPSYIQTINENKNNDNEEKKGNLQRMPSRVYRDHYANDEEYLNARLDELIQVHEISFAQAGELRFLRNFDIIFLCDDSGSMRTKLKAPLMGLGGETLTTRWEELKSTVEMVLEIALCFDDSGIDVYFLNRPPVRGLQSYTDPRLHEAFEGKPKGHTPLAPALRALLQDQDADEGPILLLISTDGCPTDDCGEVDMDNFQRYLQKAVSRGFVKRNVHVSFLCCTDREKDVEWLNTLDREVKHVDVSDDYLSEKTEVLQNPKNNKTRFNRADYVVKALLGPTSSKYDDMDFVDDSATQAQRQKEFEVHQLGGGDTNCAKCLIQ